MKIMNLQRYSYFVSVCNLDDPNYKEISGKKQQAERNSAHETIQ